MSTWGPGLYQDDLAKDVQDHYKDQLHRGKAGATVTQELEAQYQEALSDAEDAPIFWFALADTQWNLGRLEETVKIQALKYLESGIDLRRWNADPAGFRKRTQVLEALRKKLLSAQPPEKKISQYRLYYCQWELGDVYAYRLSSEYAKETGADGKYLFFIKVGEKIWHPGHRIPVVYFYWKISDRILHLDELEELSYIPQFFSPEAYKRSPQRAVKYSLALLNTSAKAIPQKQLTYMGNVGKPERMTNEDPNPYPVSWKDFEKYIVDNFRAWGCPGRQ